VRTRQRFSIRDSRFSIRHLTLGYLIGAAVLVSSCGGDSKGEDLEPYLCTREDVGDEYQELARGNFSPRDLADLGPDPASRVREFEDAGMKRGRFAFFKQSLPRPPFEPPIDLLCQVIEFESEAAALAFVEEIEPEDSLATTAMAWIPGNEREFEEAGRPDSTPGLRMFSIVAGSNETKIYAGMIVGAESNIIRTVAVGSNSADPDLYTVLQATWAEVTTRP
jgi:hypothetical protein